MKWLNIFTKIRLKAHLKEYPYKWDKISQHIYELLLQFIKPNDHVLEWGCATGHISFKLAQMGQKVSFLAIRETPILEAREIFRAEGLYANFYVGNFRSHFLHYDFTWNTGVIQSIETDKERLKFIKHASEISDGFLEIVPDTEGMLKKLGDKSLAPVGVVGCKE